METRASEFKLLKPLFLTISKSILTNFLHTTLSGIKQLCGIAVFKRSVILFRYHPIIWTALFYKTSSSRLSEMLSQNLFKLGQHLGNNKE